MFKKLWKWLKREEQDVVNELHIKVANLKEEVEDHVKLMDYRVRQSVMALNQLEIDRANTFNLLNSISK